MARNAVTLNVGTGAVTEDVPGAGSGTLAGGAAWDNATNGGEKGPNRFPGPWCVVKTTNPVGAPQQITQKALETAMSWAAQESAPGSMLQATHTTNQGIAI